jgi:hypothetical protein
VGETDIEIGITVQPTTKLRICRTCLVSFDPAWRVKMTDEPVDMADHCPACGADLSLNPHIRKADKEVLDPEPAE